jgi:hypothetical protein
MQIEFDILRSMDKIINVPRPIAARKDYHCALVTEHVRGKPLFKFMKRKATYTTGSQRRPIL